MLTQIINGQILTPQGWLKDGSVLISDGKILEVTNSDLAVIGAKVVDAKGMYIIPGFVAMNVHGGGGHDFKECTEEAFHSAIAAHMKHGATTIFPTLSSSPKESICKAVSICEKLMAEKDGPVLGLHVEGPYLNAKMAGNLYDVKNPDKEEYMSILESTNCIKRWDASPELPGADTLRLYEMFLGPINQSKPWDSNGIDGCFRFLKKTWNLFYPKNGDWAVTDAEPTPENLKSLHKLIKKVSEDIEEFSYNTSVPAFMIAVSELTQQKCTSRAVLEQLVVLMAPFTPHIAEELWHNLGHDTTVCDAPWPVFNEEFLKESSQTLSISFNGKTRFTLNFPADATKEQIEATALAAEQTQKHLEGKQIVKVIVVPGRIVNIVVK